MGIHGHVIQLEGGYADWLWSQNSFPEHLAARSKHSLCLGIGLLRYMPWLTADSYFTPHPPRTLAGGTGPPRLLSRQVNNGK